MLRSPYVGRVPLRASRTHAPAADRDGAHVYVLRYDKPAAVIVPVEWYEQVKQAISEEKQ